MSLLARIPTPLHATKSLAIGIGGPPSYITDRLGQLVEIGIDFFISAAPPDEREVFAAKGHAGITKAAVLKIVARG